MTGRALKSALKLREKLADPLLINLVERVQNALIEIFPHPLPERLGQIIWLYGFFLRLS